MQARPPRSGGLLGGVAPAAGGERGSHEQDEGEAQPHVRMIVAPAGELDRMVRDRTGRVGIHIRRSNILRG
jgi:hypothetical protein